MKARISQPIHPSIILDEEVLFRIKGIFDKVDKAIAKTIDKKMEEEESEYRERSKEESLGQEYELKLSNGLEREFNNFEDFLPYCHSNSRKLVQLGVSTKHSSPIECYFYISSDSDFFLLKFHSFRSGKENTFHCE